MDEFLCSECDLRFSVIWHNDYTRSHLADGDRVINHCPFCACEITDDDTTQVEVF